MNQASIERRRDWRRTMLVPVLIAFAVILVTGNFLDRQNLQLAEQHLRAETLSQISLIRAKLEGNVASTVQVVKGLVSTIATEPGIDQDRFEALARNLFAEESQLRSVSVAPDLVIRMTYPLAGNEAVLGLDYRMVAEQWAAVEQALASRKLVVAGPVNLVQGGEGLVVRFPVYTGEEQDRRFWGLVAAVIDLQRLYAESGLFDSRLGLDISITGQDGTGRSGQRFFGPDLSGLDPVTATVMLPSGDWQIAAVPQGGWAPNPASVWSLRAMMFAAGALILFPIALTARMVSQRHEYIDRLARREAELAKMTRRLNLALDVSNVGVWELDLATGAETWDARTNQLYGVEGDDRSRSHDHWRDLVHPDDRDRAENDFRYMIANGRYQSDYRVIRPDGELRYVRSVAALFCEPGQGDKVVGVNWDITEDVRLNEDLRHAKSLTEARNAELEAARTRIEHNALHDSLTGLPNRRYLDEVLMHHADDGYFGSGSIALLHLDLDRFKQINDTLGHAAGDAMLIHASQVLRANCRETDFIARIGGDEFVIVSTAGANDQRLCAMAERIVVAMRKPAEYAGHECRFGVSIGVAVARSAHINVRQLLVNADIALYRAKARGRNRHEFFTEELQAEVVTAKRVADEVLVGLDADAFLPHYQPQFDAQSFDLVGVEALARWRHPDGSLKTPDSFMAAADELNVMEQIDETILEKSLRDLQRWDEMGLGVPRVSVNVSLRRLHDEGLLEHLASLSPKPGRLAFELVESIYLDESDGVVAWQIDRLKEMGIEVEIDDFGTGYASIVSLQKLHPRRLKIDRQLVMPILDQPAQRQLVASIVDIGKSMDIEIVAEGVETMQHAHILRDLGCDILQGYAFARPMSRDDFEVFLQQQSWRRTG